MKLLLHIVRKDLVRMRWWLLTWAVLLALPIAFGVQAVTGVPASNDSWELLKKANAFVMLLDGVAAYLLVVVLLQEDSAVGTQPSWLTRPIAGSRMVGAKVVTMSVILFVMPATIAAPWWLWVGFGADDMFWAAVELAGLALLLGIPAAVMASLTDTIARTLLWTLVLVAVISAGMGLFLAINQTVNEERALKTMRGLVTLTLLLAGGAWAIVNQYRVRNWRRTLRGAGVAVAVLGLAQLAMTAWPDAWLGETELREEDPEKAAPIAVGLERALRQAGPRTSGPDNWDTINTLYVARGVPEGLWLQSETARHDWTWTNLGLERRGYLRERTFPGRLLGLKDVSRDEETERWRQAHVKMPGGYEPYFGAEEWKFQASSRIPQSVARRMLNEPPKYESRLWFNLVRPVIKYELPLQAGARRSGAGTSTRIVSISPMPTSAQQKSRSQVIASGRVSHLIETSRLHIIDALRHELKRVPWYWYRGGWREEGWVLINRSRGEMIGLGWAGAGAEMFVHGVAIGWQGTSSHALNVIRNGVWEERPGWLEGAVLARVELVPEAVFNRDVRVDRLAVVDRGTLDQ